MTEEQEERLAFAALCVADSYEAMSHSGCQGESEDHFWSCRESFLKAVDLLAAIVKEVRP